MDFRMPVTNLTETLYLDTLAQTARQTGYVFAVTSSTNSFHEVQGTVTGYVTVTLSAGPLTFDTGPRSYGWDGPVDAYTFDSSFQNSFNVNGNYTLGTSGGSYRQGYFGYRMVPMWSYLYDYNVWSTTADTNVITLSMTNSPTSYTAYAGPPNPVIVDLYTADHFHLQLAASSSWFNWTLHTPAAGVVPQPPTITLQPQSQTVSAHSNVVFTASATGPPPLNYQWRLNGTTIAGATSTSLVITDTIPANLGFYDVVVANPYGMVGSPLAVLSMYPYLAVPFAGAVTYWGKPAALSVWGWGTDPLSYQWFKDGAAVPNGTNWALYFASMQFTNGGMYSVVISSPLGSVTNSPAQVVVNPAGVSLGLYALHPGVTIDGVAGYSYVIQRSLDLSSPNAWTTMTNLTLTQPVEIWVDTSVDATLPPNRYRFYRVLPGQ